LALNDGDLAAADYWLQHAYRLRHEHGEAHNRISDLAWLGRLALAREQPLAALEHTTNAVEQLQKLWGQAQTWVWELPDVLLCHAEALAAANYPVEGQHYLQRAYEAHTQFFQQIDDDQTRHAYSNYPINARLLSAWQAGAPRPYPQ
jgi:hypothetical protein